MLEYFYKNFLGGNDNMEIIENRNLGTITSQQFSGITDINILTIPPNSSMNCMADCWDVLLNIDTKIAYIFLDGKRYDIINDSSSYATIICLSSSTDKSDYYHLSKILYECGFLTLQDDIVIR